MEALVDMDNQPDMRLGALEFEWRPENKFLDPMEDGDIQVELLNEIIPLWRNEEANEVAAISRAIIE